MTERLCKCGCGKYTKGSDYCIGHNPNSHKKHSNEIREKISLSNKRAHKDKEYGFKKGSTPWNKDKTCEVLKTPRHSYNNEFRKKQQSIMNERYSNGYVTWNKGIVGKNSHSYVNGSSFEDYPEEFNEALKESIRKRDNRTCQECRHTEKQLGYKLSIHHIDYDKTNLNESNLISLCKSCHAKTNYNRDDWIQYYKQTIGEK